MFLEKLKLFFVYYYEMGATEDQWVGLGSGATAGWFLGVASPAAGQQNTTAQGGQTSAISIWINGTAASGTPTWGDLHTDLLASAQDIPGSRFEVTLPQASTIHGIKVKPTVQWTSAGSLVLSSDLMTDYDISTPPGNSEYKTALNQEVEASTITLSLPAAPTAGELDIFINSSVPE